MSEHGSSGGSSGFAAPDPARVIPTSDQVEVVTSHHNKQARELLRHIPEAAWDATVWLGGNYVAGTVDVADRIRIVAWVLRAQSEQEASDG